jgi:serine protease Do
MKYLLALFALSTVCTATTAPGLTSDDPRATIRAMSDGIADVFEQVSPSVVVVRTEAIQVMPQYDFFGRLYGIPRRLAGQGSGVILDKKGYVLTSNHVVDGAQEIELVLADETILQADLVGQDPHTDLAVLKIKDLGDINLVPIKPGDSDKLRVGEYVIAIGSPFSLSGSVVGGLVSQKGRSMGLLPFEDFIQTDAQINPGNSGGPLVDVDGRLVGINAVIQTAGPQGSIGIGFAVPVNRAIEIASDLKDDGEVDRPWLGIVPEELTHRAARRILGEDTGVYIAEVFRDTPAYKGGLYKGDIVLKVNDTPVATTLELMREVFRQDIGSDIEITVLRANRERVVNITSERMPSRRSYSQ